jgi:hypothetical protein
MAIKEITFRYTYYGGDYPFDGRNTCWRCGIHHYAGTTLAYVVATDTNDQPIFQGHYCAPCTIIKIAEAQEVEAEVKPAKIG